MKQLIFVFALIMGTSISASTQNAHPKVIVLLAKASWCQVCKADGPRFEKDVMPMIMKSKNVIMVMNDLSDESSKAMSNELLDGPEIPKSVNKKKRRKAQAV